MKSISIEKSDQCSELFGSKNVFMIYPDVCYSTVT